MIKYMDLITSQDTLKVLYKKMAPPLVTLLSSEPEIQYVSLRNINLIVQKRPTILAHEIKVFFCKYNDPIYVKMEKLEIMIKLASDRNVDQVLMELKEYATEVDVEFVRRSVRAIGRCAIKLERRPRSASTCCSSSSRPRSTTWCRRPSSSSRTSSASSPTGTSRSSAPSARTSTRSTSPRRRPR